MTIIVRGFTSEGQCVLFGGRDDLDAAQELQRSMFEQPMIAAVLIDATGFSEGALSAEGDFYYTQRGQGWGSGYAMPEPYLADNVHEAFCRR